MGSRPAVSIPIAFLCRVTWVFRSRAIERPEPTPRGETVFLPHPRGPLSEGVITALRDEALERIPVRVVAPADALADDDLQLALWVCYELHYRGFDEVADQWEWEPALIALRRQLEHVVLSALRVEVVVPDGGDQRLADRLRDLVDNDDGPSVARYVQTSASLDEFLEFVRHRSLYQLKEADPHTWAVPRLSGRAKAALVEIQTDEYGNGDPAAMHSELFRVLLAQSGLSDEYGAYIDDVPASPWP